MWIDFVHAAGVDGLRDRVQSFSEAPLELYAALRSVDDQVLLWVRGARSGHKIVNLTQGGLGAASGWSGRPAELKEAGK